MDGGDTGMATPLNRANQAKEDEFYTQLSDIESESVSYTHLTLPTKLEV